MKRALFSLLMLLVALTRLSVASPKDDAGYVAWLTRFQEALDRFERFEGPDDEDQVKQLLLGKPTGGAPSYGKWLAMYGAFLDKLDRGATIGRVLDYAVSGRPAERTEQYGPWFESLAPRLSEYDRFTRPEQWQAIQRMLSVVPAGTETFYPRWLALYDEYMELYRRFGRAETKQVLDVLARVKPQGSGGQAPEFLREPERTMEQVTADPQFVDRYLDLTALVRQRLAYQAANGNVRAREQLDRLRQIAH
ncbi:MAG: hypothetical protein HY303_17570 [Candidatus Wallbacteria bacterium]|nr:hypothetical protein [Candidatus Wallbacteria bacterium]